MRQDESPVVGLIVAGIWIATAGPALALVPDDAPTLPPPDPAVYTVVEVDTAQELADACWNLTSNTAIVIAPGTYDLSSTDRDRLTIGRYGAAMISDIQIRGATGDPADVVILGAGMTDPSVQFGFQIFTASDVLIADLSVGSVYYHAVAIQNDQGATRVRLYHLRLFDAGQQIVKGNANPNPGAEDVVIEFCDVFYTAGVPHHPALGYCYTNGIDALPGRRWIIRDNLIRGIRCQDGSLAGPAILMWGNPSTGPSVDTVVERNTILDSSRGISLGLGSSTEHTGGIVRNNFIRWNPAATYDVDVPIYTTSPGAKVVHNTVLTRGLYGAAVEVRFPIATGVEVRSNLMDAGVSSRDGASPTVADNLTSAHPSWFVDEATGDLHLARTATDPVDLVTVDPDCTLDFDGTARPTGAGLTDIGADEMGEPLFADGFESGGAGAWSRAAPSVS